MKWQKNSYRSELLPFGVIPFTIVTITFYFSSVYKATEIDEVVGDILAKDGTISPTDSTGSQEILSKIAVPNNQV